MIYTVIKNTGVKAKYSGLSEKNTSVETVSDFKKFVEQFPKHQVLSQKSDADIFIGSQFKSSGIKNEQGEARRCADNVSKIHFLTLDYDSGIKISDVTTKLNKYSYLLYTTFSHKHEHHKFRLIIPLTEPVTVADFSARKLKLKEIFDGVDSASFSVSQGFYMPSVSSTDAERKILHNYGDGFDLLALVKRENEPVSLPLLTDESTEYLERRHKLITEIQLKMVDGQRTNELKKLAIALWKLHARKLEIEISLKKVISSFPVEKQHEHKEKAQGLASWVVSSGIRQFGKNQPKFNPTFVPKSDASEVIKKALNDKGDTSLLVTAGVGKTEETIGFAIQQARQFKKVAIFVSSHDFQLEIKDRLDKARAVRDKKATWLDEAIVVSGRGKGGCDFYDTVQRLQEREAKGETKLVKNYCKNECLYANGEGCLYADQFTGGGLIKVYTHAYLFTSKSVFDEFTPDLVIIDEDILQTALVTDTFTHQDGKKIEADYYATAVNALDPFCYCGALLKRLADEDLNTPEQLLTWVNNNSEIVMKAFYEHKELKKTKQFSQQSVVYKKLFWVLANVYEMQAGTQSVFVRSGVITHAYLKKPRTPKTARVIHLDATGDSRVVNAIYRRNLKKTEVNVEKQNSTVAQVVNASASQNRVENIPLWNDGRMKYLSKRGQAGAYIVSKKKDLARRFCPSKNGELELYFGKLRGSNLFQYCDEMHVAMAYNLPANAIEAAARAVFYNDPKPFNIERIKEFVTLRGVGKAVQNFNYKDYRMQLLDDHLSRAELEQGVHRARLVQRTSDNPVTVYIHTNRVLNITVDKVVKWQDLYGVIDGNGKRSISNQSQLKEKVINNMGLWLQWKRNNVMSLGLTADQWKRQKDINVFNDSRLLAFELEYKDFNRKLKKTSILLKKEKISAQFHNRPLIELITKNEQMQADLKLANIKSITPLFGGNTVPLVA